MDDVGRLWLSVVVCAAIVAVMAFVCACENAATEFNDAKLKKLAAEDKRAERLKKMTEDAGRFVSANLISRSVLIIVLSAVCTVNFFEPLTEYFRRVFSGWDESAEYYAACGVSLLVLICVLSLVITVFGVNLPKKLCVSGKIGESFILSAVGFYRCWLCIFKPLEIINDGLSRLILRIFGVKNVSRNDIVTEEEILLMVDAVNETGGIEESQAEMISNIFEFDDIEVREVMTHRTEVVAIEQDSPVKEAVELAIKEGFSRIPVYEENIDNICGVIFAKDLLNLVFTPDTENHTVREYKRDIMFVPESNMCRELFKDFTEQKAQIAVAVDDYGGTAGIITMEDLLETIVGSIQDEYDDETEEIRETAEGVFEIVGNAGYSDVMEALGKDPDEDSVYETIGAMVIDLLGEIPSDGETPCVKWENIEFSVLEVKDKKIEKLRACIIPENETQEQE